MCWNSCETPASCRMRGTKLAWHLQTISAIVTMRWIGWLSFTSVPLHPTLQGLRFSHLCVLANHLPHLIDRSENLNCHAKSDGDFAQRKMSPSSSMTCKTAFSTEDIKRPIETLLHRSCAYARSLAQTLERFGVRTLGKNLHQDLWLWL